MGSMQVNVKKRNQDKWVNDWPDGYYEARVNSAELDIAKSSGNPIIKLVLELFHPDLGTGIMLDNLPEGFVDKCLAFYLAFNHITRNEYEAAIASDEDPVVDLDPDEMIGASLIVQIGDNEYEGKVRKQTVGGWYYPDDREDLIPYLNE